MRYRRHVSADADSPADDAEAPLAASERIAALDVLRGFALLGVFIMNMPAFSHSIVSSIMRLRSVAPIKVEVGPAMTPSVTGAIASPARPRLSRV